MSRKRSTEKATQQTQPPSRAALRILLVNSNTSESVTKNLSELAAAADTDIEFTSATAPFGAAYVEGRAEAAIAAHATLVTIARSVRAAHLPFDACIIACFGEPGLGAARELFDFPIVGIAEASMYTAAQVSSKFAILTRSERWPAMIWELATIYGQSSRCAGIFSLAGLGLDFTKSKDELGGAILKCAGEIRDRTDAGALILGGAALTGFAPALQRHLSVPIIDGLTAAVGQARHLATLKPFKPLRGTYSRPGKRMLTGIDPELAACF